MRGLDVKCRSYEWGEKIPISNLLIRRKGNDTMTRLLKALFHSSYWRSPPSLRAAVEAQTPTNMTVTTPGGTANYISLFSNKNTIVKSRIVQKGGNVGIGTTTPSSPLTVNGAIQSLAGGFMFPDNSVQSSAGLVNVTHDATLVGKRSIHVSAWASPIRSSLHATSTAAALQVTNPYGGAAIFARRYQFSQRHWSVRYHQQWHRNYSHR